MSHVWAPSVRDVAGVIPARAHGTDGLPGPTFDADTTPSADQVQDLIDAVASEVATAGTVPAASEDLARIVTAVGAASYVELGFFPEQNDGRVAQSLWERYEAGLRRLRVSVAQAGSDQVADPLYSFPAAEPWPCA